MITMKQIATENASAPAIDVASLLLCMLECQSGQQQPPASETNAQQTPNATIDPTSLILCLLTCMASQVLPPANSSPAADSPQKAQNLALIRSLLELHVRQVTKSHPSHDESK